MSIEHLTYRDPDVKADDYLTDLECAAESSIKRAFAARDLDDSGVTLRSVDVTATEVPTSPRCERTSMFVSLLVEVQNDGRDLNDDIQAISRELCYRLGRMA